MRHFDVLQYSADISIRIRTRCQVGRQDVCRHSNRLFCAVYRLKQHRTHADTDVLTLIFCSDVKTWTVTDVVVACFCFLVTIWHMILSVVVRVLACQSLATCCCFSPNKASLAFGGTVGCFIYTSCSSIHLPIHASSLSIYSSIHRLVSSGLPCSYCGLWTRGVARGSLTNTPSNCRLTIWNRHVQCQVFVDHTVRVKKRAWVRGSYSHPSIHLSSVPLVQM